MTKLGLITTSSYQRLLYTSVTKKDVFSNTARRQISSTSSVWKDDQSPPQSHSSSDTESKNFKDESVKTYDISKGEITNKTSAVGSSGPRNLDEAKSLLQKQYELTKNQIEDKSDLARKQLEDKRDLATKLLEDKRDEATKLLEDKRDLARKLLEEKIESVRVIFGATPSKPRTPDEEWYYKRVSFVWEILKS